ALARPGVLAFWWPRFERIAAWLVAQLEDLARAGRQPAAREAFIETATACGLELLSVDERQPLRTTTFGAGQMFAQAIADGAQSVFLTIGGSATNDGGTGFARALGYRFLDADGNDLPDGGGALQQLARIVPPAEQAWAGCHIVIACDVDNPLLGENGAAAIFGPQKGASPEDVAPLDAGLANFADCLARDLGWDGRDTPGAGAAGGLGSGLMAFFGGTLRPGVEVMMDAIQLEDKIAAADLVITGEGRTDGQTLRGKVCAGVAKVAAAHGVPCVILSGAVGGDFSPLYSQGVTAVFSVSPGPRTLTEAYAAAEDDLAAAAENVVRLIG
ncbi:MAG: glycerate kinase, partial [Lentisphaeria bacterium]|nr:glycerate kinase [Lentisphaeria bacterium]